MQRKRHEDENDILVRCFMTDQGSIIELIKKDSGDMKDLGRAWRPLYSLKINGLHEGFPRLPALFTSLSSLASAGLISKAMSLLALPVTVATQLHQLQIEAPQSKNHNSAL